MLPINYSREDKKVLLAIAKQSIIYGLQNQRALPVKLADFNEALQTQAASFVTLNLHQQLRGCIGTLQAHQALINDVAEHAFSAAFEDPRFAATSEKEIENLDIHISVLTPSTPMKFKSEMDLLAQLQPGIDGLILQSKHHKATFLPSVWEQLNSTENFLNHLKIKAGLNQHDWPDDIEIFRYETIGFSE